MPLVFVHGVSNRDTPGYRDNQFARDAFLRQYVVHRLGLGTDNVAILNPYWGDKGVTFRWGNASLPESFDSMETFGTSLTPEELRIGADILAPFGPVAPDVIAIARRSLADAIDLVWAGALPAANSAEGAIALAASSAIAFDYAAAEPAPKWLDTASNDNFIDLLLYHIQQHDKTRAAPAIKDEVRWEHFGSGPLFNDLREGLSRLMGFLPATGTSILTTLGRRKMHLGASMFVGDVFTYLDKRGEHASPGPIVEIVLGALQTACENIDANDPQLILVGHSLGGVILYDILTYFAPTLEVDAFVTVGSQVALFEEMGLYRHTLLSANAPTERLVRPANIKRWLNVLDPNDVFSFRTEGVFEGVTDFVYDTGYGLTQAHSGYFHRPSFYRRLGERLADVKP